MQLTVFMQYVGDIEPEAAAAVGASSRPSGVSALHHRRAVRLRTIAISERYHQEAKRRFRPGRGFGSERNLQALVRLPAPQHNCLIDRIDRLEYAARRRGDQPVEPTTAYRHESRDSASYTKDGT